MNFVLTRANVDDREQSIIDTLTDKVFGKLYADKGYISQSLFGHLWNNWIHIVTGLRSNMKQRLMPLYDKIMLRKRSIIESINDMLKNVAQLVQMTELFQTTRNNITLHIRNIFKEGELEESSVCKEFLLTAADGKRYKTKFYSLDVIISVGYRVKSI